jgi:SAM-dependent methyltransferase
MPTEPSFRSLVDRAVRHFIKPVQSKLETKYLEIKYRHHACDRAFDWNWEGTNYNRIALVNLLISRNRNPSYLEIGCQSNSLFDSVPSNHKVGVDPAAGGTVRATSDAFFENNTEYFDVIFIDGLHTYEQVQRDVSNSIRFLKPGGYVALHDMLPGTWIEHHVPRISEAWTGDVWKVAFELSRSRGIDFKIVKIDHGVGVFRVTKEKPQVLQLAEELEKEEFEYLYQNISKLPLVEWKDFVEWVG